MPKRTRRQYTDEERKQFVQYYKHHGHTATLKHFDIWGSVLYAALRQAGMPLKKRGPRHAARAAKTEARGDITMTTLVLARKLRKAIVKHIADDNKINDVELTALLLVNELIGSE